MTDGSDMAQIMNMTTDIAGKSLNMAFKLGSNITLKGFQIFLFLYNQNKKIAGGVSFKKLVNTKGPEVEILKVPTENKEELQEIYRQLEKRGVMFTPLEDLNIGNNQTEIMYHVSDAAKVKAFMDNWEKIPFNRSEPEIVPNASSPSERDENKPYVISFDEYAKSVPDNLYHQMQSEVTQQLETQSVKNVIAPEEMQKSEHKVQGIVSNEQTNTITINEHLITYENDQYFISRVPGKKDEFLVLPGNVITTLDNGKTRMAKLNVAHAYPIVNKEGKFVRNISGKDIHRSYDVPNESLSTRAKKLKERAASNWNTNKSKPRKR